MIAPVALCEVPQSALVIPKRSAPAYVPRAGTELGLPSISFHRAGKQAAPVPTEAPPDAGVCLREIPGVVVPVCYVLAALLLALCNLVAPGQLEQALLLLCPLWSLAVLLHTAARDYQGFWSGVLLAAAYPFLVLLADEGYTAVYTVLFAWFATPRLTPSVRDDRGVWLVLTVAAWAGVLGGVGGAIAQHGRVGLNVACFSALTLAMAGSRRIAGFRYRVVAPLPRPGNDTA